MTYLVVILCTNLSILSFLYPIETLVGLCGADVDVIDQNGSTPLFYAVTLGHVECATLLLSFGADPNKKDKKGRTPAHFGATKGQLEALKILKANKADLWIPNIRGDVTLHEAVHSGRLGQYLHLLI